MRIEPEIAGRTLVVRMEGEFDLHAAEEFRRVVDGILDGGGVDRVVVNLKAVTFIDSSGLGAILGRYRRLGEKGGALALAGPPRQVRQLLDISGILRVIPVYTSEKAALAAAAGVREGQANG